MYARSQNHDTFPFFSFPLFEPSAAASLARRAQEIRKWVCSANQGGMYHINIMNERQLEEGGGSSLS